jgi:uncharacterized protein (TIGR03437 family)
VTFDGIAAPLLFVSPGQINAIVPFAVSGRSSAQVLVTRYPGSVLPTSSSPVTVGLKDTSPAIFAATGNGHGQGAILNVSVVNGASSTSANSAANPAPAGSLITLFATGVGAWDPPVDAELIFPNGLPKTPANSVSLTIGGQPARIIYQGGAPYLTQALLQINAQLPANLASGTQPVVLKVGPYDNAAQKITMEIQ